MLEKELKELESSKEPVKSAKTPHPLDAIEAPIDDKMADKIARIRATRKPLLHTGRMNVKLKTPGYTMAWRNSDSTDHARNLDQYLANGWEPVLSKEIEGYPETDEVVKLVDAFEPMAIKIPTEIFNEDVLEYHRKNSAQVAKINKNNANSGVLNNDKRL
jgi:hypothetical protein